MIVVGEDVAVPKSQGALTGRRGLAGTVLVYKIAGHLATTGASLNEVEFIASLISNSIGTIGMGLDHCHVYGTATSTESYLKDDEAELGMGIVSLIVPTQMKFRCFSPQCVTSAVLLTLSFVRSITSREFRRSLQFLQPRN